MTTKSLATAMNRVAIALLLCLTAGIQPGLAAADITSKAKFDIPPQQLPSALLKFAEATGVTVTSPGSLVEGKDSPGVVGTFEASAALSRLLTGTELRYEIVDNNTVLIAPLAGDAASPSAANANSTSSAKEAQKRSFWDRFRLAEADPPANPQAAAVTPSESGGSVKLEEVVVTAQKRQEFLKDVPIAISVLRGDQLDRSSVQDVNEALSRVPGVSVSASPLGGSVQVPIRGVSVGQPTNGGASTTAYYLETVPFGFVKTATGPDPDAYDLNRVEVLRGPQGTLYGASALNGVVRVLTNDANPDSFDFKGRASASSTERGGENYRGDMAINVPIIEGKLAVRAVADYQNLSGWIDKSAIGQSDANDAELRTARLKVNAQPNDKLSIGAFAWISRSDYGSGSIGRSAEQNDFAAIDEPISTDYDAYGLKVAYDFSGFSLSSMTSYLDYRRHSVLSVPFAFDEIVDADTFAQEVVATSAHDGAWRWTAGAMYRDSKDKRVVALPGIIPSPDRLTNLSESYAAFGELTRILGGGKLELTGGLRYFEDRVGLRELSRLAFVQPPQYTSRDATFHAAKPRVALTWFLSEQVTAYASYAEGFRSGAHQVPSAAAAGLLPIKPDTLKNYEIGAKGASPDRRLGFDAAIYYMDWRNVQRTILVPVNGVDFTGLVNGKSASGVGVDLGVNFDPLQGLSLGASLSWNDLRVDSDVLSGGVVLFDKGDRLDLSPETTLAATASYAFKFGGSGLEGRFSASANYTSKQNVRALTGGALIVAEGDPMSIARASFSISAPRGWALTVFADNVTNEKGTPVASPDDPNFDIRVRPRTIGVQLDYRL